MSAAPIEAASLPWCGSHATKAAESSWPRPRNGSASIGIGSGGISIVMMLRGFYQYFGLHHCKPKLDGVRREVRRQWARTLRRRSQRHRLFWSYLQSQSWFELPYAVSTRHTTV